MTAASPTSPPTALVRRPEPHDEANRAPAAPADRGQPQAGQGARRLRRRRRARSSPARSTWSMPGSSSSSRARLRARRLFLQDDPACSETLPARGGAVRHSTIVFTFSRGGGRSPSYVLGDAGVAIGEEDERYFERLEADGIKLTLPQRPGGRRKTRRSAATCGESTPRHRTKRSSRHWREPISPASLQPPQSRAASAAFRTTRASRQYLLGSRPQRPEHHVASPGYERLPPLRWILREQRRVHWPLRAWLKEWAGERDVSFGDHYGPHDGDRESLWLETGTRRDGAGWALGGSRPAAQEQGRGNRHCSGLFSRAASSMRKCCVLGLKRLRLYRKEWDDQHGVWKDRPRHDEDSHGTDAFLTFACSGYQPPEARSRFNRALEYRDYGWMV